MTSKEKAEELIEKYQLLQIHLPYEDSQDGYCIASGAMLYNSAKNCTIIAVDEILNSIPLEPNNVDWDDCGATHKYWYDAQKEEALKFWQEVKQELEKP
jgi:hypothetical protein